MRIALIARSTLTAIPGGDTVQVTETARCLRVLGAAVHIYPASAKISYQQYDLLHFFNLIRPADILQHIERSKLPFVVSPNLVDYAEYDRHHRRGPAGRILKMFTPFAGEYLKTVARWLLRKDSLASKSFLWKGQQKAMREIIQKSARLLPNSASEYRSISQGFNLEKKYSIVANGIDPSIFTTNGQDNKNNRMVLCAARFEGLKNQLSLIRALNDTNYTLILAGAAAPNQLNYYDQCRKEASQNILFTGHLPQQHLMQYYRSAKVHVLPSWFETCGLSSLEAAAMNCNVVITRKGFAADYFCDDAFYCDPADITSIRNAIDLAANSTTRAGLREKILAQYTWQAAAASTLNAYKKVLHDET